MIYNLRNDEQKKAAELYLKLLSERGKKIELKEVRKKSSISQNNYLHLLFSWFSLESGYDKETVKNEFFKRECNKDLFEVPVAGSLGNYMRLKSSTELDTKEMTVAIERFRNWSQMVADIYLPEPNEQEHLDSIRNSLEQYENQKFI